MLYAVLIAGHSWLRWIVVASALIALGRALSGLYAKRPWQRLDQVLARIWVGAVDLQLTAGFALYFGVSPVADLARRNLRAAWEQPALRFFGLIHPLVMLAAFVATHATWIWVRRTDHAPDRFRRLALGVSGALLLVFAAVPWPFLDYGRPLLRP
ncbi:Hypothetical protein A7982_11033 [Minicystis rosea]|nr:Hypothetical protein A7982_11033 [Minicystis rosea]